MITAAALAFPFIIPRSSQAICRVFLNGSSGIQGRKTVLVFRLTSDCTSAVFSVVLTSVLRTQIFVFSLTLKMRRANRIDKMLPDDLVEIPNPRAVFT